MSRPAPQASRRVTAKPPLKNTTPSGATNKSGGDAARFAEKGGRVDAVMEAAERSGLLLGKSGRIGGRISPRLIAQAKRQTGIDTDTDLIEFALANVALDDEFPDTLRKSHGAIDPALKLGF